MKGKRGKEDIDLTTLPEFGMFVTSVNFLSKDSNWKRTKEAILKTKRTDFIMVNREDIKLFAKEKGLYVPLDDKKKDKVAENVPRECTPEVMAEAYNQWLDNQIVSKRIEKKEIADALASGKPLPTKKKEEKKKDPKKKKEEEEVEEIEEQYTKDYEFCIILENYPETSGELLALGQTSSGFDLLVNMEPEFNHKKKEVQTDAEAGVINEELEQAEENEEVNEEIAEAKLTSEEFDTVQQQRDLAVLLTEAKINSLPKSRLRNALATDLKFEVVIEDLNSTWDRIKDIFFKHLADESMQRKEYMDWLSTVKVNPLIKPKASALAELEAKKEEVQDPKDKKKADPKDKKKKDVEEVKEPEVPKVELPKEMSYIEAKDLLSKMEKSLNIRVENLKAVNTLDVFAQIIEKHKTDFDLKVNDSIYNSQTIDSSRIFPKTDIDNFLDDIFDQVLESRLNTNISIPKTKEQLLKEKAEAALQSCSNKQVYPIHDSIGLSKRGEGTVGETPLEYLEEQTFSKINVPGVDRYGMPAKPSHSARTRKNMLSQINSFHDVSEPELKRRLILKDFDANLEDRYPYHGWQFFDRNVIESFDRDTFRQRYIRAKMTDPWTTHEYSPLNDCTLISMVDHTSKSFVDTRSWQARWSLVPDFEDWLAYFKSNEGNLTVDSYFDLDSQKYGQISVDRTTFDMKNGGFVRLTDRCVRRQNLSEVRVDYYGSSVAIEANLNHEKFTKLIKTQLIERDLTPEEMEIHNPILKDKKKKRTKEDEEKLIRTIQEEKVTEDIVYVPPEHSRLSLSLQNGTRVLVENERIVDFEKLSGLEVDIDRPIDQIFGIQSSSYAHAAVTTVSLANGVIMKVMSNGDILMKSYDLPGCQEDFRLVNDMGTVISYLSADRRDVKMSNGNTMTFDGQGTWTSTNNKGLRKVLNIRDKSEREIKSVPATMKSHSPLSVYPVMCYREDGVTIALYATGDRLSTFADGTKIFHTSDGSLTIIESSGLPVIRLYNGEHRQPVYRITSPLLKEVAIISGHKFAEVELGDGSFAFVWQQEGVRCVIESIAGDIVQTNSEGKSLFLPAECRWQMQQLLENGRVLADKRSCLERYFEEIERTAGDMMEAMSNMSKFVGKGAKKLNKKQLREEREKEENKIAEYRQSMIRKLHQELVSIQDQIRSSPTYLNNHSGFLDQFDLEPAEQHTGFYAMDINTRQLTTKDIEGRQLVISDEGQYSVYDSVNVICFNSV